MPSAQVEALEDVAEGNAVELGGPAPAGKTSAAHAAQVVALAPGMTVNP